MTQEAVFAWNAGIGQKTGTQKDDIYAVFEL
jgi:hypothetical protein